MANVSALAVRRDGSRCSNGPTNGSATALSSGWDYYSGFIFKLQVEGADFDHPLVAGGRYDGMLTRLGSPRPIPAVGFSVWIDRLAARGGAA